MGRVNQSLNLAVPLDDPGFPNSIAARLYLTGGSVLEPLEFIADSVHTARTILHPQGIGFRVVVDVGGAVTAFDDARTLAVQKRRPDGSIDPQNTDHSGALAVRSDIDRLSPGRGRITDEVVVIFGPLDPGLRGHTVENGFQPDSSDPRWFVTVNRRTRVETTMFHEILHCANAQHYMTQFGSFGKLDIMADQLTDDEARQRSQISSMVLGLLRQAYFYR